MIKYICFYFMCFFHLFVWFFVLFAFLNKKAAYFNIYYLIPIIYIIHMLPFHIIITCKSLLYPDNWEKRVKKFERNFFFINYYNYLKDITFKKSFANPLSPQGLLLFGIITSIFSLYKPHYLK